MFIESLISYLGPRVTQYLFSHLKEWAQPVAQGVGCKLLNFSSEAFEEHRQDVAKWVRHIVPGQKFDDHAVRAVDGLVVFAMQEIAEFIECEIKLHGLNAAEALERATQASQIPDVFEKIASKVVKDSVNYVSNF